MGGKMCENCIEMLSLLLEGESSAPPIQIIASMRPVVLYVRPSITQSQRNAELLANQTRSDSIARNPDTYQIIQHQLTFSTEPDLLYSVGALLNPL